ncbi:DUF4870 domain-containing protein [Chloroflexota bacterium]
MGLSPEERQKIYEEEKARLEARERIEKERQGATDTGLPPNVAGLLCYVGGWISGIIFLILEPKNKWIRFHAAQSIVVFGAITVAGIILGWIPIIGDAFAAIISVIGFILWIILMVKAHQGERFRLPWAGEIAERIAGISADEYTAPPTPEPSEAPPPPPPTDLDQRIGERIEQHFKGRRAGRIAESSFAIAWSIVAMVFFNFFHQYIAYYSSEKVGDVTIWTRQPFFTEDISLWLPILNLALIMTIVGNIILIIFDRYTLRETINIVLNAFSLASVVTLLTVYPFDFGVIPNATIADGVYIGVRVLLILVSIGIGIGMIVRFIKLIVHLATQVTGGDGG